MSAKSFKPFRETLSVSFGIVLLSILFFNSPGKQLLADVKNGFDLADSIIPHNLILQGGPPRDGIPSIDNPKFLTPDLVNYMKPQELVLGVVIAGQAKAYPIHILNWHEIVNDRIGSRHFVVSYCPLCGTGMVFSAMRNGSLMTFGVSGLLYNSDVLLYDRQTNSLWSQVMRKSISGKLKGTQLKQIAAMHTTWENWLKRYPQTKVLSRETGATRNYDRDPYSGYEFSQHTYFPVTNKAPRDYHPKERVLGVTVNGVFKAYPFVELAKNNKIKFADSIAGKKLNIHWDKKNSTSWVTDNKGREYPVTVAYWFAWFAFHPETLVFKTS